MKILHVEDNPRDAELTQAAFAQEWPACTIDLVDRRDTYLAQLGRGGYDLILCDFNLVNFDGSEALRLAREKSPDTPFIYLSGTIGEDRAVEALRGGASDYVLKDRPKRLVPAIHRVLEETRRRREQRAAEEQLLRVQRLENIGMLAAGIAHDFNNVLAPVLMAVPLLRDRLTSPGDQRILNNVEKSVERGAGLVRQILGFVQGATGEPHLIQPRHLLRDLVDVLQQTFPNSIRIICQAPPDLWPLKANPTQLHQILLNLCVNARDAMPNGGTLQLRTANCRLDEVSAAAIAGARAGPYLRFEITDSGSGISPDVLARIWEPFFTTKEAGRGTGLGLPTVRGLVEGYHGVITLHSRVGHGTTFQVFLPASPEAEGLTGDLPGVAAPSGRGELILVVDDDEGVRDVSSAILSRHGYRVLAAANGTEAVALFAARSLEVRLVVTDLSMPHLDGVALAKVVRGLSPSTRILAMSGVPDARERLEREQFTDPLLVKPFSGDDLLRAVHALLEGSGQPHPVH